MSKKNIKKIGYIDNRKSKHINALSNINVFNELIGEYDLLLRKKIISYLINKKEQNTNETFCVIKKYIENIDDEKQIPYGLAYISDYIYNQSNRDDMLKKIINKLINKIEQ